RRRGAVTRRPRGIYREWSEPRDGAGRRCAGGSGLCAAVCGGELGGARCSLASSVPAALCLTLRTCARRPLRRFVPPPPLAGEDPLALGFISGVLTPQRSLLGYPFNLHGI